ncbi:efflux transporter outer membrane subunit [Rhizorhabdus dicambivorans]|uniref:RND transporter n=1 Tax=Rhizorhabdus dicambivorans TaxID=1850238 RepID=A0A2A4FZQ8_9SPHN|nr:efflux transporter outer membrane subunit [Rhizorhabdus dicambivorans]ATE63040.1 RND transporter [Rhizorhabdus dicambivorans]PCE43217.1 RND transporter [Rhizorhabdus dicambivorans]
MSRSAQILRSASITTLVAALLSGCAAVPQVQPRVTPLSAASAGLGGATALPAAGAWWKGFGDPQLDRIMADALAGNPSLDAATARLARAQAGIAANKAGLLPQIDGSADATRQRLSDQYIIPPPYGGSTRWIGNAQANLGWSLDLAGRQKALVAQAAASADAAGLDLAAARVTLSGAVAQAYVDLARATEQARIADRFVASREQQFRLAQVRQRTDLSSDFDLRAAETLLAEARQAKIRADGARQLMIHALAALAGRGADYHATITDPVLTLDRALPVPAALPADLLGRRPDILAARARIEAAEAGRRVAKADFYPDVDLKGLVGLQAIGLGSLFTGGAATYGAGAALHLPIFEGGRLKANYKGAVAGIDEAIASYNGTVVGAVRESADALSAIATNAADAAEQRRVSAGLAETMRLDQVRLRTGLGVQLDVLGAGDRLLAANQREIDLAAEGAAARIRLLVALGGSFDPINQQTASATPAATPAGR